MDNLFDGLTAEDYKPQGRDRSDEIRLQEGMRAILRWCESTDEPLLKCLHEIEEIARRHLGLKWPEAK
jgi:hypothetical protein